MAEFTVVFADLAGSTGVFELLGNVKATQAITRLTQWVGRICESHNGHVVKYLGDGVLILFAESSHAIEAARELQQLHHGRICKWPNSLKMKLQIGMARGDIVEQDGDYYGDSVNLASRLSELSGPEQILASDTVIQHLPGDFIVRARCMGNMSIRGRSEACTVHRIEWQAEALSELFTIPARLIPSPFSEAATPPAWIELSWMNFSVGFSSAELPVFLGRNAEAQFIVNDRRVSREHARIEWRANKFYLEDVSSYGTWVRFADSNSIVALRRQGCVLLLDGEIALGAPFEDVTVPTVTFRFYEKPLTENMKNTSKEKIGPK